ncbi:MAG: 4Fe-4S dicluster domain-containing protein [bacterium]|nr:4Fe-4S dicluster domain-containing protein [bacterium]
MEGKLNATINEHQLDQIITYIMREYDAFGVQKKNNKTVFDKLEKAGDLLTWAEKPIIPFKKILWPNSSCHSERSEESQRSFPLGSARGQDDNKGTKRKVAFLGLTNCDAEALDIFLKEFSHTDLLPKQSDILVVTSECKPNENCFCTAFGKPEFKFSDLHIQEEGKNFELFTFSKTAQKILDENGVEKLDKKIKIREIENQKAELLDLKKISSAVDDKADHQEYWQKIADNCFGCGACTAVCPLCFCFRCSSPFQGDTGRGLSNISTSPDLSLQRRGTAWDSCYSKSFSKISNRNFRPENADRLYNWYHHKFCRSMSKNGYPLCTGCGRCIDACPAHLNQHHIVNGIENNTNLSSRAK